MHSFSFFFILVRMRFLICFLLCCRIIIPANTFGKECIDGFVSKILGTDDVYITKCAKAYNVIVPRNKTGFAILTNGNCPRILGYSQESVWKEEDMPPVLINWLKTYENHQDKGISVLPSWNSDYNDRFTVQPLIKTLWHQNSPYNNYAPIIEDGNVKTVAGCVAIASAQITYYWWRDNPTATLKNTPLYPYGAAPVTYSIPKGTPNDWELIKAEYDADDTQESKDAVARLCYVIGTTSYLNFANSTGGQIEEAAKAMLPQYNLISDIMYRNNCSQEQWDSLLYNEVANGRPVLCAGQSSVGHAFVLDGYDCNTKLYHFNFGWGGKGDGYYPIDDSEYSMGGYKSNQSIVYNVHPKRRNIQAIISVDSEDDSVKVYVDIMNCGTLPIKILLYSSEHASLDNEKDSLVWTTMVDNNNEWIRYEDIYRRGNSKNDIYLKLYDDYNALIAEYKYEVPDEVNAIKSNDDCRIWDINGNRVEKCMSGNIYIIRNGNKMFKVLW